MSHLPRIPVLVLALSLAACGHWSAGKSLASVTVTGDRTEVTLIGLNAQAEVAGEVLAIRDGRLSLDGVPCGEVPPGAEVSYVLVPEGKTLRVAGELRTPRR